ncbi:MAG: hypothetical protein WCA90_11925, partial [Ilumatobacteraceae bacterium]
LRDQHCRVPGCTHSHVLEVHHIIHWQHGGPTDTNGQRLRPTGARPVPPGAPPPPPTGVYQHPLGERLDTQWLHFNPPPEHRATWQPPEHRQHTA